MCSNLQTLLSATCSGQQYLPVVEGAIMRVLLAHSPEYTMKILCSRGVLSVIITVRTMPCSKVTRYHDT